MKASSAKQQGESQSKEPLTLFEDGFETQIGKQKPGLWLSATAIVFGFVLACAGVFWVYEAYLSHYGEMPQVYFEIKAISASGHPVAGANVALNGQDEGVTDSFGEWRKYLPARRGSAVTLELEKLSAAGRLFATKNLVVPLNPPQKGDISILKTIALAPLGSTEQPVAQALVTAPADHKKVTTGIDHVMPDPVNAESDDIGVDSRFAFDRVQFKVTPREFAAGNQLGKRRYDFLAGPTLSSLKKAAIGAGIAIDHDAPWQVTLTHLSVGNGASLIEVESQYEDHTMGFVRNYYKTPELTAAKILSLLKLHAWKPYTVVRDGNNWHVMTHQGEPKFWQPKVGNHLIGRDGTSYQIISTAEVGDMRTYELRVNGKDPCAANKDQEGRCTLMSANFQVLKPHPNATPQFLAVAGEVSKGVKFYFTGLQGHLDSNGKWRYWGETGRGTNLTVVRHGKVVLRERLINGKPNDSRISIPVDSIARR